jgi:hypothetical protein
MALASSARPPSGPRLKARPVEERRRDSGAAARSEASAQLAKELTDDVAMRAIDIERKPVAPLVAPSIPVYVPWTEASVRTFTAEVGVQDIAATEDLNQEGAAQVARHKSPRSVATSLAMGALIMACVILGYALGTCGG